METEALLAVAGGVITVLGAVVGVTRHLTQVQEQAEREKITAENRQLQAKVEELEARRDQLIDQVAVAARAGNAALHQKAELDNRLQSIMSVTGASGGSIYVPVRSPRGEVQGLAFLCIEPFTVQTQVLRAKMIPLHSLAGRCFTSGQSFCVANASRSADHFRQAAAISQYQPSTTLNIALANDGKMVGVLQLLSKEGEKGFEESDVARVSKLSEPIAADVAAIVQSPDLLRTLGLGEQTPASEGTILCFDLSRSSVLFQEVSPSFALQLLNEYFERICEPAFRAGATLDKYLGDGGLMRFNVPRPQRDFQLAALKAAIEMRQVFQELRDYWTSISPRLAEVHHRAAIATGPVLQANLGHSQFQNLTIIGHPISVASALCESAERDKSIIVADADTYQAIKNRVTATQLPQDQIGKAAAFTDSAWEIVGLT